MPHWLALFIAETDCMLAGARFPIGARAAVRACLERIFL